MTSEETRTKIPQLVGELLRQAEQSMPDSTYKDGYITALHDVLELKKEKEGQWQK